MKIKPNGANMKYFIIFLLTMFQVSISQGANGDLNWNCEVEQVIDESIWKYFSQTEKNLPFQVKKEGEDYFISNGSTFFSNQKANPRNQIIKETEVLAPPHFQETTYFLYIHENSHLNYILVLDVASQRLNVNSEDPVAFLKCRENK